MTPQEKAADSRLWNTYGIRLADYDRMLEEQGGTCAICHKPPVNFRLNVDHCHKYDMVEVVMQKVKKGHWVATAQDPKGEMATATGKTSPLARKALKRILRARSIRGLLCFTCNKGLAYYRQWVEEFFTEVPELFENAANYIRRFNQSKRPTVPHETKEPVPSSHTVVFTNNYGGFVSPVVNLPGPGA